MTEIDVSLLHGRVYKSRMYRTSQDAQAVGALRSKEDVDGKIESVVTHDTKQAI